MNWREKSFKTSGTRKTCRRTVESA